MKDRDDYALAQLQVERYVRSIVEKLGTARMEIFRLRGEINSLRIHVDRLERERKGLMEVLERGAIFIVGRGLVLTVRVTRPHVKRRMCTHPTWQLDRVCAALSAQHTIGADVLGQ